MGEEAEELLRRRFAIIQVWRPINHPVESHPLAICDAQTVRPETLVVNERHYQDRVGQTFAITYDPGQRWYWFPPSSSVSGLRSPPPGVKRRVSTGLCSTSHDPCRSP